MDAAGLSQLFLGDSTRRAQTTHRPTKCLLERRERPRCHEGAVELTRGASSTDYRPHARSPPKTHSRDCAHLVLLTRSLAELKERGQPDLSDALVRGMF